MVTLAREIMVSREKVFAKARTVGSSGKLLAGALSVLARLLLLIPCIGINLDVFAASLQ